MNVEFINILNKQDATNVKDNVLFGISLKIIEKAAKEFAREKVKEAIPISRKKIESVIPTFEKRYEYTESQILEKLGL